MNNTQHFAALLETQLAMESEHEPLWTTEIDNLNGLHNDLPIWNTIRKDDLQKHIVGKNIKTITVKPLGTMVRGGGREN